MAYSEQIKNRAFEWYVEGFTFAQIALNFAAQGQAVSQGAISAWSVKEDWTSRKEKIDARRRENTDEKLGNALQGHTERLIAIADRIANTLENTDPGFKTTSEAVATYTKALSMALKLSQPEKTQVVKQYIQNNLVVIFDDYNQIIEADPVLGEQFRLRKPILMDRLLKKQEVKVLADEN